MQRGSGQDDLSKTVERPLPAVDRARGALLGLAAGDAVGTTVEFSPPGSFTPLADMAGGGPFGLEPGQWTDDTSMGLCLAESLVERGGHDPVDQLRRYVRWMKDGYLSSNGRCFDIGMTTRMQLARFIRTGEPHDPVVDEHAAANGSLMRLAPVSIRWAYDETTVTTMAAASSRTTHPASRPVDACRVLAAMTAALIRGEPWEKVSAPDFWSWGPLHPEVESVARGSWRSKQPPAIKGSGYCVAALEAALWAVAGAADFRTAVLRAANLGDDADTTAAIAGQLAGARFGAVGIPQPWLDRLAMREQIESLAEALHAAATGAHPAWPCDASFHAWWVHPGRLLAGEHPCFSGFEELDARLGMLAAAGIETTFDLALEAPHGDTYAVRWQALGERLGRTHRRLHRPIGSLDVLDRTAYKDLVGEIDAELAAGRAVFVHCMWGIGRTGTVIGAWLRSQGHDFDTTMTMIRHARAGTRRATSECPETDEQLAVIRHWI